MSSVNTFKPEWVHANCAWEPTESSLEMIQRLSSSAFFTLFSPLYFQHENLQINEGVLQVSAQFPEWRRKVSISLNMSSPKPSDREICSPEADTPASKR